MCSMVRAYACSSHHRFELGRSSHGVEELGDGQIELGRPMILPSRMVEGGHMMRRRIMIAAVLGSAFLDATSARAEEKFLNLTGGQIQARFSDMEITDEVGGRAQEADRS
jgi:hypothetical protein